MRASQPFAASIAAVSDGPAADAPAPSRMGYGAASALGELRRQRAADVAAAPRSSSRLFAVWAEADRHAADAEAEHAVNPGDAATAWRAAQLRAQADGLKQSALGRFRDELAARGVALA